MTETLQHFLEWIHAHPHGALVLLFFVCALDAVFVIGAFVPAAVVLFSVGAIVALGSLELWSAVAVAAAGAVAGDGFSFWLGRRYGESLFASRFFRRYPEPLANSRRFFARHGAKGVMLARFLGPVRAVTPALAGSAGMRSWMFCLADGAAAVVWALAYIMPGVVFGASLGLAAEVAGRLATLLLILLVVLWLTFALTRLALRQAQKHAEEWVGALLDWSRRHRRLRRFGAALSDPMQPETPALLALAALLLSISGLWLWLWAGASLHPYPTGLDATLFQTLRDLHTPWGLALAQALLTLGHWSVYVPVAVVAFAMLLVLRKRRAAAHWLAAVAFGLAISLGLDLIPTLPPPYRQFGTTAPLGYSASDLVLPVVIYAFLPVLLAHKRSDAVRTLFYGAVAGVLLLLTLARLYLGAQWFSLALFSLLVGTVWTALLGLGYRRHRPEDLPARPILIPVLLSFLVAASLQFSAASQEPLPPPQYRSLDAALWRSQAWRELPSHRQDVAGRSKQALPLQWAGTLPEIEAELRAAGWQDVAPLSAGNAMHWLTSSGAIEELPVLPQVHAGNHPALSLRLPIDETQQELIRLWPSGFRLDDGRPLWVGLIVRQRARDYYRVLRYPVADTQVPPLDPLLARLPTVQRAARGSTWLLWP